MMSRVPMLVLADIVVLDKTGFTELFNFRLEFASNRVERASPN
jgi:Ni2+-binding GTPase involved in maturation of urease and hydrogenase